MADIQGDDQKRKRERKEDQKADRQKRRKMTDEEEDLLLWNVERGPLTEARSLLEKEFPDLEENLRDPFLFLYAKGVHKDDTSLRRFMFERLRNPSSAGTQEQKYTKARERLEQLVLSGGGDKATDDPFDFAGDSLEGALKKLPKAWNSPASSYVFFRDGGFAGDKVLVQRFQKSGLCYMHAPVVLQHYAVAKSQGTGDDIPMIDIRKHILHHFPPSKLEEHVFKNRGDSSRIFLQSILERNSLFMAIDASNLKQEHLEKNGPALVSQFEVHSDFLDPENYVFNGQPPGESSGQHAMVLVGIREENGETFFLVQNWWKEKQFVEVSVEYLKHSHATIYFIKTPQQQIPDGFDISKFHFVETETIDLPEEDVCEME